MYPLLLVGRNFEPIFKLGRGNISLSLEWVKFKISVKLGENFSLFVNWVKLGVYQSVGRNFESISWGAGSGKTIQSGFPQKFINTIPRFFHDFL